MDDRLRRMQTYAQGQTFTLPIAPSVPGNEFAEQSNKETLPPGTGIGSPAMAKAGGAFMKAAPKETIPTALPAPSAPSGPAGLAGGNENFYGGGPGKTLQPRSSSRSSWRSMSKRTGGSRY